MKAEWGGRNAKKSFRVELKGYVTGPQESRLILSVPQSFSLSVIHVLKRPTISVPRSESPMRRRKGI